MRLNEFKNIVFYDSLNKINKELEHGVIAIIKYDEIFKHAAFQCPCGCKEMRVISLQPYHSPHWEIEMNDGKITISPSIFVDEVNDCGAHFFVRDNMVDWV